MNPFLWFLIMFTSSFRFGPGYGSETSSYGSGKSVGSLRIRIHNTAISSSFFLKDLHVAYIKVDSEPEPPRGMAPAPTK
jgi:hypothetical protein